MQNRSNLARLLQPKTIAIVGGGPWCEAVIQQTQKIGFKGSIQAVHPNKKSISGLPTVSKVGDLSGSPDAVFIGVNRHALIDILPSLNKIGAGGAVCFASGFMESGEQALNQKLLVAAGDMALLGPNCYGFINYLDRCALWPDQHGGEAVERGVAIIVQSSNIGLNITMQQRGLPLAYIVTVGNQAQTGLAEVASQLLDDDRVTALGLHIEGFGDLRAFEQLALKAYRLSKPIIILKVGRSSTARTATVSHTASLAGSDVGAQALIDRLGFARVQNLTQFLDALILAHVHGKIGGKNIASLSCSGGEASLMADAAMAANLHFPILTTKRKKQLGNFLGELVTLANPLDYHTDIWRNREAMAEVLAAMSGPDIDLTILVLDFPNLAHCDEDDWIVAISALKQAAKHTKRPFAVIASLPENMPEKHARHLIDNGIAPLCGIDDALAAVHSAASVLRKPASKPVLLSNLPENSKIINEYTAKKELTKFGLKVPSNVHLTNLDQIPKAMKKLVFPVVLKGEGIAHKTEASAVALGLGNTDAVYLAAKQMDTKSFILENQVENAVGELLIGIVRDPAHGFLLTIAAGGILTEILDDIQTLIVPATRTEIKKAVQVLRYARLLNGYRNKPVANFAAIIDAVLAVQNYVVSNADSIVEVEINPLICTPSSAVAADALINRQV